MKLQFIGADHEVTGSCHFLQVGDKNILIDCGMEQGADIYENAELSVNPADIDYVLVTHAHIDHSGRLPLLFARGFRGRIFATKATTQLCDIMLKDSAHIQEQEAEWKNRKAQRSGREEVVPMYTTEDAVSVMEQFEACPYNQKIEICPELTIEFHDAGHLLGSAWIEVWAKEEEVSKKIIFSGDLGNGNRALIRDPELPKDADYLLIESTYGNRNHDVPPDYAVELAAVLNETFDRGGNVVIPAFSVGRTQEILYYMKQIKEKGYVSIRPDFEVYVDSPMAIEATHVFNADASECFKPEALAMVKAGDNPIAFPGLKTAVTSQDSMAINFLKTPSVIISASGMCEAGRIRHHLKHNLWRSDSTIVFVGYQVPGTLGFNLLNGAKEVKLFGEDVHVAAKILNLPGISGHADHDHLLSWVAAFEKKPDHIFVVHGEDTTTDAFAEELTGKFGLAASAPYTGEIWDLARGVCIKEGNREKKKKIFAVSKGSPVYERLLAAGQRLLKVIQKNKEGANKDLAKFADQINALSDKWDRN